MVSHVVAVSHDREHTAYRAVMFEHVKCFLIVLRHRARVEFLEAFRDKERVLIKNVIHLIFVMLYYTIANT